MTIRCHSFVLFMIISLLVNVGKANVEDQLEEMCQQLVEQDKCRTDKELMMKYCEKSCIQWQEELAKVEGERVAQSDGDFFDFSAKTSTGKVLDFERFEGYFTMVVNVALSCSPANNMEEGLNAFEHIKSIHPYALEIIIFPFKHPNVDYDTADCSEDYAALKKPGRKIHVMEEAVINGDDTHPVYQFLKKPFKITELIDSLPTFFFVRPDGVNLIAYHGATMTHIIRFLSKELIVGSKGKEL